jgi:DNA-binding NtrC family response regulator
MRSDITGLIDKDRKSAVTITALNRDLTVQLDNVKRLKEQLAEENAALREEIRSKHNPGHIIGSEGSLSRLMEQASQLASLPVTVLITGESGTGKELLARYLHEAGARSKGPFITVNCAALPATLFESELFGHEKGSFTGATSLKKGKFEIADGGTLFLDEVGEIPLEAQAKLLRALQLGEVSRIGGAASLHLDVRVVAATNRNLLDEVRAKRFRDDLYYRLKVVELRCPSLRERLEDLPTLVQNFIESYSRKLGKEVLGVSPSALEALAAHSWPGNIRELENMVARAVALTKSKVLGPADFTLQEEVHDIPDNLPMDGGSADFQRLLRICGFSEDDLREKGLEGLLEKFESICVEEKLSKSKSQKEAAEALGLTQTKLHRLLKKFGMQKKRVQ